MDLRPLLAVAEDMVTIMAGVGDQEDPDHESGEARFAEAVSARTG